MLDLIPEHTSTSLYVKIKKIMEGFVEIKNKEKLLETLNSMRKIASRDDKLVLDEIIKKVNDSH